LVIVRFLAYVTPVTAFVMAAGGVMTNDGERMSYEFTPGLFSSAVPQLPVTDTVSLPLAPLPQPAIRLMVNVSPPPDVTPAIEKSGLLAVPPW
jgi:hypothetical protein